jgi:CSLREA domain-containing protein
MKKPPKATLRKQLNKKTLAAIAQAIEPRLLFSADTAALAITPLPEVTTYQVSSQHQQSANTNSPMQASAPSQLFVLDLRIQDAQGLLAGLMQQQSAAQSRDETFEILVLDSNDDGISKISHALAKQGNISALHLMGHGDDGMMVLGSTWIDQATLRARASDFASWANGLSTGSDILIYGCDFAANEAGKESAKSLAQITGADVAASTDKTANVLNGGNWALEYQVGQLQNTSNDVISAAALWQGDLATYIVTNNADAGAGSLRQAISDANLNAGSDTVFFNILGSTFQSINLQSPLPTIIDGLFIDGATQSGWTAESLKIELNGANAGTLTNGLSISSTASVTVRGLVINNFDGHGILIEAGSGHVIAGNIIGLNASASAVLANSGAGIHIVNSANNRIGGLFPSDRNIISGNAQYGIALRSGSDGTVVSGNYIGTDFSGSVALGNLFDGVTVTESTGVVIGGEMLGSGNLISGNIRNGIGIYASGSSHTIAGNIIGLNATGTVALANQQSGIAVANATGNLIGGSAPGARNVISGNGESGIYLVNSSGNVVVNNLIGRDAANAANVGNRAGITLDTNTSNNQIGGINTGEGNVIAGSTWDGIIVASTSVNNALIANRYFSNSDSAIDLNGDGVNQNDDAPDADTSANGLQNYPAIYSAIISGTDVNILGELRSAINTSFLIQFYSNPAGSEDPTGYGEGYQLLGFATVTTDASGFASLNTTFSGTGMNAGDRVSAIATVDLGGGQFGSTSEFSLNTAVVNLATISGTVYEDTNANGQLTDDGVAIAGAIVSLYRDNGDGVIGSGDTLEDIRNTNASGQYTFNNLTSATYWVVVDSRTFSGTSGLNLGFNLNDVWAEQTYGSSGSLTWSSGSYAYSATAGLMLGGMRAERSDNGASLLSAEHVTRVILAGTNQTAVDYGFSFNAITNTRDSDDVAANNRTVQGSLRQFIQNSNALTGVQSSEFRVATTDSNFAGGVAVISLSTSLPTITDTILLDATTQTNWSGNTNAAVLGTGGDVGHNPVGLSQLQAPEVEIRDFVGDTNLLKILGNNTVIRGFSLVGGGVAGDANSSTIEVSANNVTIERNLIGSSANTVANPGVQKNAAIGIRVLGQATIDGNILAYIAMHAISVETGGSNSAIYNNEFVAPSSVFNDQAAVAIRDASNVQVNGNLVRNSGGNAVKLQANAESNIIRNNSLLNSGNLPDGNGHAIDILGSSDNNLIEGNLIEASAGAAIAISGSADNKIGGTTLAQANAIINNAGAGVLLLSSAGGNQAILGNLIYGNAGLGIDLNADGVSPNDNLPDPDVGPNDLQNFPVLNLVTTAAGNTTIAGYLNGAANTRYRIEFFSAAVAHTSGHGQAQNFLGFTNILTNAMGNANFNVSLPGVSLLANTAVSATATVNLVQGSFGSTSEFSANVSSQTTLPGITVSPISGNTSELGASATFSVVLNSAPTADVTITIASNTLLEGTASRSSLTFTSANWNVSQVVTVTGVNEDLVDGDHGYSILLGSAISSDSNYSGLDVPDVTVINVDNDVASNITVTTSDDTNDGDTSSLYALQSNKGADGFISLREAIIAANNTPNGIGGIDQILFNIADPLIAGAHTINLESALPTISTSMSINATTEPDFFSNASQPMVVLNGNGVIQNGITINASGSNSNIRGLIVQGFTDNAIYIQANSDGNTIAGNYLGQINAQGIEATALNANGGSGVRIEGSFNTIGGANLSDRNIIAGNYAGISVVSGGFNRVMGNFIGTDASGARSVANRDSGIHLEATNSNLIGGSTIAARNVISGNLKNGILLDMGANRTSIFGNYIGTDSTGLIAVGNNQLDEIFYAGVTVLDSIGTQVGGGLIDHGNVISGNFGHGVTLGNNAMGSVIAGNTIGLGSDGLTVIGNSKYGVKISTSNVLVGGTIAADRNVISGNSQGGVYITGADATENQVQGNYIGTDRNGQLDRGNTLSGVAIDLGASRNQIGGAVAGGGNVISGNNLNGVALEALARGNDVSNNFIGIGSDGVTAIGNSASGVRLSDGASNNLIGGTARIFHNKIMHNEGAGVLVSNTGVSPTGNAILGNEIALNSGLEIDLGPDGVNTNDLGDGDSGVNQLQNFPVLTSASSIAGTTTISGYINSEANSSFRLEFFSSNTADLSGHGDASTYIGFLVVTTDNSGNAYFTATLAGLSLGAGQFVSATATQFMGAVIYRSTSELASNIVVGATSPGITVSDPSLIISESGSSAQFNLVLNAAPLADVTIALSVSNPGEAILSTSFITFTVANWNIQQAVTITGLDDSVVDGTQAFSINIEPAASLDLGYSGLDATNVSVQNLDNDTFNRIIVDTTSDRADGDTSSIAALYASKGADGRISLREAVLAANNTINGSQRDEIVFNISQPLSNGLHSISLTSALPEITDAVIIDGTSEPDYAATQVIALNGLGAGNSSGLIISASDSEISGLNLSQFQIDGIKVYGNNNVISNNFISSNNGVGIYVQDATVLIKSNAISNQSKGIVINGLASLVTVSQNQADSVAFLVDLTNDGTTPNDLDDADVGPNGLLNKPVITSVNTNSMSQVQLNGAINTQANRTVSIEVYEHGQISQGARSRYVGTFSITTDASGNANFSQSFGGTFAAGTLFSATAISTTSPNSGSSSEHSDAVRARAQAPAAAAVLVTQTLLNVNESGTNASFGLVLASAPVADVVINLSTSQAGEVSLSTNVIVFTPLNWNVTQFVTATGVQDYVSDGSQTINIITSNAVSTDANYDGLDVVDVTVSNLEVPNLAPMILAPSGFTATEDTTGNLGGSITGLSINDPDAGNSVVSLTLTTSNGSFSLISIAGLTFTVGNGSASNLMTFQGSVAAINNAINVISFTPEAQYSGSANFSITVDDLGNSGIGGALSASRFVPILVSSLNDGATLTGSARAVVIEGGTVVIQPSMLSLVDIDTDVSDLVFTVMASTGDGEFMRSGVSLRIGDSFSQADIDAQLIQFSHFGGERATANVTLSASERFGNPVADFDMIFSIIAVNDPPIINSITLAPVLENSPIGTAVASVSAMDVDSLAPLSFSLVNDAQGTFKIDPITGLISVKETTNIDFETNSQIVIRIRASDSSGAFVERDLTVLISDIAESTTTTTVIPIVGVSNNGGGGGNSNGGPTNSLPSIDSNLPARPQTGTNTQTTPSINTSGTAGSVGLNNSSPDVESKLQTRVSEVPRSSQTKAIINREKESFIDPSLNTPNAIGGKGNDKAKLVLNQLLEQQDADEQTKRRRELNADSLDYLLFKSRKSPTTLIPANVRLSDFKLPANAQSTSIPEDSIDATQTSKNLSVVIDTIEVGGMALSVGAVAWATRAGGLLAALLSAIPAWKGLDPLLVLSPSKPAKSLEFEEFSDTEIRLDEEAVREVL